MGNVHGESRHRRSGLSVRSAVAVSITLVLIAFIAAIPRKDSLARGAAPAAIQPDIIFVEAPIVSPSNLTQRFPQGSYLARLQSSKKTDPADNLTPEFFAAADPSVAFDGTKVLFSGQKTSGGLWQVWEMNPGGSQKAQITNCAEDCLRAGFLPAGEIVYTVASTKQGHAHSYLAAAKNDGSQAHRITFGPGDYQLELVLRDGRIFASASWPLTVGEGASSRLFYTLRPDGTGLESFRCDHQTPGSRSEAEELDDGALVFMKSTGAETMAGGNLARIARGSAHNALLGPTEVISSSPRQLTPEKLVVARWIPALQGAPGKFDLYSFDLRSGAFGERVYAASKMSSIQPVPVVTRTAPRIFWSTLKPAEKSGYFICLDANSSADAPNGRFATPAARVRVMALDAGNDSESTLGEAPVEKDGSFYVAVPADRPVRFELLDSNGQTVHAEKSWIWARPGEEHGCPGCHADKALVPENRWPMTLRRFDSPTQMGTREK